MSCPLNKLLSPTFLGQKPISILLFVVVERGPHALGDAPREAAIELALSSLVLSSSASFEEKRQLTTSPPPVCVWPSKHAPGDGGGSGDAEKEVLLVFVVL